MDVKEQYKHYINTLEGTKTYKTFTRQVYGPGDRLIGHVKQHLPEFAQKPYVSILDIGGGNGKRLQAIIEHYQEKMKVAGADLIEQSEAIVRGPHRNIRPHCSTFEDYALTKTYDLALMIHSYFSFQADVYIKKIKKHLHHDGTLLIVGNSSDSFLAGLKTLFDGGARRKEIDEVKEDLTRNNFYFEEHDYTITFPAAHAEKHILPWISMGTYDKNTQKGTLALEYIAKHSQGAWIEETEQILVAQKKKKQ